eukprot:jgi/Botrbrau1/16563/Bobra.0262s0001.1
MDTAKTSTRILDACQRPRINASMTRVTRLRIQAQILLPDSRSHDLQQRKPPFRTILEPFKIKVVEPIQMTSPEQRLEFLEEAGYNLFKVKADDVLIDLLTDSGTGAMSQEQLAALMKGDESYAGAKSWFRFRDAVSNITGFPHIFPTHQGRAAERLLFKALNVHGKRVLSNTFFDTTRANVEDQFGLPINLLCLESLDPRSSAPFKGNINIAALEGHLQMTQAAPPVAGVVITVTNNSGGGQPVSMANLREASAVCKRAGVPLFLDACRFAENAFFIKDREPGFSSRSVLSIAQEMFSLCDGATFSAKKDGLANSGGFVAMRDSDMATRLEQRLILEEGFVTYGGLPGRDLEAIAVGLHEVVDEEYLRYRMASTRFLGNGLVKLGVPIVEPPGGHAIYIDAAAFLPHIPRNQFPGHAVAVALYLEGGVRSCEIGSLMFGGKDPATGEERRPNWSELCRLAIPRRVYTQSHMEYVLEVAERVVLEKEKLTGFRIVKEPVALRHFSAALAPVAS